MSEVRHNAGKDARLDQMIRAAFEPDDDCAHNGQPLVELVESWLAQAWDEGRNAKWRYEFGPIVDSQPNPYRVTPPVMTQPEGGPNGS